MKNKNCILTIFLSVLIVGITAFIFSNSMADGETSHEFSNSIIDLLFLRKLFESEIVQYVVRKAAHMIEFALLGSGVMGLAIVLHRCYRRKIYGFAFFYVLFIAVIDEHIQRFSVGRTSSTSDVLLDLFGSIIGFCLAGVVYLIILKCKNNKAKNSVISPV